MSVGIVYQGTAPNVTDVQFDVGELGAGGEGGDTESLDEAHDGMDGVAQEQLMVS
jgi:hypothetical protein